MTETQVRSTGVTILDRILETKVREVAALADRIPDLERRLGDAAAVRPHGFTRDTDAPVALIAEVKRRSPGAGEIRPDLSPDDMARGYEAGGASALSVLTDRDYFGGSLDDLKAARATVSLPVLRKDFTIHESQLLEARASGADIVLLIVRILDDDRLRALHRTAEELGMAVLVEAHDREEVERGLGAGAKILGINNRDLSTFETDLSVTEEVMSAVPPEVILVSESGIRTREDVVRLGNAGVDAILVGESLLREPSFEDAARALSGVPKSPRTP